MVLSSNLKQYSLATEALLLGIDSALLYKYKTIATLSYTKMKPKNVERVKMQINKPIVTEMSDLQ